MQTNTNQSKEIIADDRRFPTPNEARAKAVVAGGPGASRSEQPNPNALLRLMQVLELVPVAPSTWWSGVKSGLFPRPLKLGRRTSCWRARDILALIDHLDEGQPHRVRSANYRSQLWTGRGRRHGRFQARRAVNLVPAGGLT